MTQAKVYDYIHSQFMHWGPLICKIIWKQSSFIKNINTLTFYMTGDGMELSNFFFFSVIPIWFDVRFKNYLSVSYAIQEKCSKFRCVCTAITKFATHCIILRLKFREVFAHHPVPQYTSLSSCNISFNSLDDMANCQSCSFLYCYAPRYFFENIANF